MGKLEESRKLVSQLQLLLYLLYWGAFVDHTLQLYHFLGPFVHLVQIHPEKQIAILPLLWNFGLLLGDKLSQLLVFRVGLGFQCFDHVLVVKDIDQVDQVGNMGGTVYL